MPLLAGESNRSGRPIPKKLSTVPKKRNSIILPPALGGRNNAPTRRPSKSVPTKNNSVILPPALGGRNGRPAPAKKTIAPKKVTLSAPKRATTVSKSKTKAPTVSRATAAPPRPVGSSISGSKSSSSSTKTTTSSAPKGLSPVEQKKKDAAALEKYMKNASSAVQAELAPRLNDLNRQIEELNTRANKSTLDTANRGARQQGDLQELFGRLDNFTKGVQGASKQNYEGLQQQTGSTYERLQQALGENYGQAQQNSNAEMSRLGLTGAAPAANAGMQRDQSFLQGLAGTDSARAQTGLGASQNSFDQLMSMARNNATTEGAVQQGQAMRDTQKTLSEIMMEKDLGIKDLAGKRGDIEGTRGERIRQLIEAMQDKDYNRNVEADQMKFERDLATQRFGMEKQAFAASQQPQEVDYLKQLQAAKLEQDIAFAAGKKKQDDADELLRQALAQTGFGRNGKFWT